jgi:hypothetical protein
VEFDGSDRNNKPWSSLCTEQRWVELGKEGLGWHVESFDNWEEMFELFQDEEEKQIYEEKVDKNMPLAISKGRGTFGNAKVANKSSSLAPIFLSGGGVGGGNHSDTGDEGGEDESGGVGEEDDDDEGGSGGEGGGEGGGGGGKGDESDEGGAGGGGAAVSNQLSLSPVYDTECENDENNDSKGSKGGVESDNAIELRKALKAKKALEEWAKVDQRERWELKSARKQLETELRTSHEDIVSTHNEMHRVVNVYVDDANTCKVHFIHARTRITRCAKWH